MVRRERCGSWPTEPRAFRSSQLGWKSPPGGTDERDDRAQLFLRPDTSSALSAPAGASLRESDGPAERARSTTRRAGRRTHRSSRSPARALGYPSSCTASPLGGRSRRRAPSVGMRCRRAPHPMRQARTPRIPSARRGATGATTARGDTSDPSGMVDLGAATAPGERVDRDPPSAPRPGRPARSRSTRRYRGNRADTRLASPAAAARRSPRAKPSTPRIAGSGRTVARCDD